MIAKIQLFSLLLLLVASYTYGATTKIVGGEKVTDRKQFAYQVSLQQDGKHFCGGTLYSKRTVITAAHCVHDGPSNSKLTVVSGSLEWNDKKGSHTQTRKVRSKLYHENYNPDTIQNDIAIITVAEDFNLDDYTKPIALYPSQASTGLETVTSGWGTLEFKGKVPKELYYAMVPIYDLKKCKEPAKYGSNIRDGMICAGYDDGSKDACQGDSGGPLVYEQQLVGVVSWGYDCAKKGYPGVYTEVYQYKTWIDETIKMEPLIMFHCEHNSNKSAIVTWSVWLTIFSAAFAMFN